MSFYLHRYSAHHHDDLIGSGGYVLVEPAKEVGEVALDGIGTYSAEAYLVGYEDEGGILAGEAVELVAEHLEGGVGVAGVEEVVGGPQGEAVDEDGAPLDVNLAQLAFFFYVFPFGAAPLLVFDDSLAELVVPHMGGGYIYGPWRERECQLFGVCALTRTLPTGYEDYLGHLF